MSNEVDEDLIESTEGVEPAEPEVWPRVVTLSAPVNFGKKTFTELSFNKGKFGDMEGIKLGGGGASTSDLMLLASRMSNTPIQVIRLLDVDDAAEVLKIAVSFFRKLAAKLGTRP